ncbi:hypothetical protein HB956_03555 [Listeria welshimeri]|nr:hypothetical protein [Listeria welshimeri]
MLNSIRSSALGLIFGGTITWILQNQKINIERKEKLNISMWQVYAAFQEYPFFKIAIIDLEFFKQNNYKKMKKVFFEKLLYHPKPIKGKIKSLKIINLNTLFDLDPLQMTILNVKLLEYYDLKADVKKNIKN